MASGKPAGVHIVGSVPGGDAEAIFRTLFTRLPGRLATVPDGEPGVRQTFIQWQRATFPEEIHSPYLRSTPAPAGFALDQHHIRPTGYDTEAIKSYQVFTKLRDEGVIPPGVRFQVCLPGPVNTLFGIVDAQYRAQAFPLYLRQLIQDTQSLQKRIPASDLAIQIDVAAEFAVLEAERGRTDHYGIFQPFMAGDGTQQLLDQVMPVVKAVNLDVPLGFHLCYGDMWHSHFVEPEDTGLLVQVANTLVEKSGRPISWVHLPCPPNRTDRAYYAPLEHLNIGDAKLFLGLVREHDLEGTTKRIEVAQSVWPRFGVATECGGGRTPQDGMDSIYEIMSSVCEPV